MKSLFRRWLANLLQRHAARQIHGVRPGIEKLEDRTLPSGGFPYVASINRTSPTGPVTNVSSVSYTVIFSETVTGVAASDFQLELDGTATGTLSQVTPVSGSVYTVTITGVSGNGKLGLNLLDNGSIHDLAGDPLTQQDAPASFAANAAQTFATGSGPISVVSADVNGDGTADLVIANEHSETVSFLLGNGNGTFQPQQTFAAGNDPTAVAVGDVNGDGKPDIIVANYISNTVSVLLGNGNGTFQAQQTFAAGNHPDSVAVGDVNGDGKPDVIVANHDSNTVSVLLGNGNGTFQAPQTYATGAGPYSVVLGDVNGDGKLDLAVANVLSNTVSVLLGNGNGTFQMQQTFATGDDPIALALSDVNGDGKPDIVVAIEGTNRVGVLLGNGNGTFQPLQAFATGVDPIAVAVSDVNGDGKPDLVVANIGSNSIGVLLGNGNGTFQAQQSFAAVNPISVAVGDVNSDRKPDVVVTSFGGDTASVLLNSFTGNFTGQVYTLTTGATTNLAFSGLPAAATAGNALPFTLTALDSSNHVVAGYTGTVHFSATDSGASSLVPADYTFVPADGGVHVFTSGAILVSSGVQILTAFDTAINALSASASVSVLPAATSLFAVNAPAVVLPNAVFKFTVTALDPFGNTVAGYSGTVRFASGDPQALLPVNSTLTSGMGVFSATLKTPGKQIVTAADTGIAGITGSAAVSAVNSTGIAPFVQSINRTGPAGPATNTGTVTFTVTFSQAVVGVTLSDFTLALSGTATGTLTQVTTVSGSVYTVIVSGITGAGTLGLNLVDNGTIFNLAGNPLTLENAPPAFAVIASRTISTGYGPSSVALGDVNGDGKPDLVVANTQSNTLSVLLGNGNGTFQTQQTFATGYEPGPVTLGDVNGDGKLDLVVAYSVNNTVSVLLGNGNGTFQATQTFATDTPISVAISDVNGDAKPDLAIANRNSSSVSVLLGNGNGTFQAQQTFAVGFGPGSVVVGDLNGDGKQDLAVANTYGNSVSVLLGNGNGTYQAQQTFAAGNRPSALALGDVSGDGKLDLVVSNRDSNTISVLLGNGDGTFQTQQTFATGLDPVSVALADVNSDGKLDVVVVNEISSAVSVLLGNGNGTFQTQQLFAAGFDPESVACGDVNGDGKADLVVANAGGGTLSVLVGNGDGAFQAQHLFSTADEPRSVQIGDVNGDGKSDLVVADGQSNTISVLLGNGDGTFQAQQSFATSYDPIAVALADVNGDGIPDVVVANYGSNTVSVLLGNGNGTFQTQQTFATGYEPISLALGDMNGDGKPDIVVANKYSNTISVLLGNGNGTFQAQQTFAAGNGPDAVALVDLNGDGKPDIVVANEYSATVSVLVGNGNGTFQAQQTFATGNRPISLAVGDVNGDGQTDVVVANNGVYLPPVGVVSVLLGNGNGTFQTQQTVATAAEPISVALGDVNGDGNPDLVVAYQGGNSVGVLLGNGNGTFQTQQTFGTGYDSTSVAVGDVNGDGKADLVVANEGGTVNVLLNAANGDFAGQAYTIVSPAAPTHIIVSATPTSVIAGSTVTLTVTAQDQFNETSNAYTGTLRFSNSAGNALLPPNATLTAGVGVFSVILTTAGTQTITATDTASSSLIGTSGSITVTPAPANHFSVSAQSSVAAGTPFTFTVTAADPFDNPANYAATLRFTSSDASATLPANATLTGGTGTFSATLNIFGSQTISVFDAAAITVTGKTAPITVSAPATHFAISAPSTTTAGSVLIYTVIAKDAQGNTVANYSGTVHITSTDGQASLSADATLTAGVGFFGAALRTAGNQTLIGTDTATSSLTGTSAAIAVSPLAANHFLVSAPNTAITGSPVSFTVIANDPFNNTAPSYAGTVHFISSDSSAVLPGDATLTNAVGVFSATLKTLGSQTFTATDVTTATITGTSNSIATRGLTVTGLTPTSTGFIATFSKPLDPSQINLYDQAGLNGPDDVLLTGPSAPQISFHGSLIIDPNNQTITFVKTSDFTGPNFNPQTGVLAAGTYTVTLRSASNGFRDSLGVPLDGANTGNPAGSNYVTTFVVTAPPVVIGIPSFARGPDSVDAINLPNNVAEGIPLNLSVGNGVTSGVFTLQYNSALLRITAASVNSALAGASLTLDAASTAGKAIIDFSSPAPLGQTGVVRLGGLVATVPNSAAALYKSKALLHFSGVQVNGGAIAVLGDDAIQVVAYVGDVNGDGTLSAGDAADISAVNLSTNAATGTLGGFSAYPLADPTIIGDLNNNGNADSTDVTLLNSFLAGIPRTQIPTLPTGLTIVPNGPDPSLTVPIMPQLTRGGIIVVPVDIDTAHPLGSTGAREAILALRYDPRVFDVSAADVQLGSLTSGWQLMAVVNSQTGEIGIDLYSSSPIQTTASGCLVKVRMYLVGGDAGSTISPPPLTLVTQVDPTGQRQFRTTVSDDQGAFILHFSSGLWEAGSGQPGAINTPVAVDNASSDLQLPARIPLTAAHFALATTHYFELEAALSQPAPALDFAQGDIASTGVDALTASLQASGFSETDWIGDDLLAYLRQSVKHPPASPGLSWPDDVLTDERD